MVERLVSPPRDEEPARKPRREGFRSAPRRRRPPAPSSRAVQVRLRGVSAKAAPVVRRAAMTTARASQRRPAVPRPYGGRDRPRRPHGERPFRARTDEGERPRRPRTDRPQSDRPFRARSDDGERPRGPRPQGDRPFRARPEGDSGPRKPQGDRPFRARSDDGERPAARVRRVTGHSAPVATMVRAAAPHGAKAPDVVLREAARKAVPAAASRAVPAAAPAVASRVARKVGRKAAVREASTMRIVGGRWRGRSLATPKSDAIRPTSDRLRESLFNVLQHGYDDPIEGARVLDLFAGTGALGLEALSRGAAFALFVDEGSEARCSSARTSRRFGAGGVTRLFRRDATRMGAGRAQRALLAGVLRSALWQRPRSESTCACAEGGWLSRRRIGGGGRSAERERHAAGGIFDEIERRDYGETQVVLGRFR